MMYIYIGLEGVRLRTVSPRRALHIFFAYYSESGQSIVK